MLEVSSHLAQVALMLFGIMVLNIQIELDSLNDPTLRPIPRAQAHLGSGYPAHKGLFVRNDGNPRVLICKHMVLTFYSVRSPRSARAIVSARSRAEPWHGQATAISLGSVVRL